MRLHALFSFALAASLGFAAFGCSSSSSSQATTTTPGDDAGTTPGDDGGTTTADTAPAAAAYPPGPYGLLRTNTFPNLTWKGYHDSTGPLVDISMSDYYDPDGKKGITVIYMIVAAQWCGPCNTEAENAPKIYAEAYKSRGARYVSAIIEDKSAKPSTQTTLDQWISDHKLNYDMGFYPSHADHSSDLLPDGPNVGLPHNYVIDPRTMVVRSITQGVDPAVWACDMYPGDSSVGPDGCCVVGKTLYSDGSNVCSVNYSCVDGKVCLAPGDTSPSNSMEVVMKANGAPPFGS